MRRTLLILAVLAAAMPRPAAALSGRETMRDWARASAEARAEALDAIEARTGRSPGIGRSDLLGCMDSAAGASGHGDLSIDEMVEACAAALSQPKTPPDQTGI